jgi:hypothetical protein
VLELVPDNVAITNCDSICITPSKFDVKKEFCNLSQKVKPGFAIISDDCEFNYICFSCNNCVPISEPVVLVCKHLHLFHLSCLREFFSRSKISSRCKVCKSKLLYITKEDIKNLHEEFILAKTAEEITDCCEAVMDDEPPLPISKVEHTNWK